MPTVCNAAMIAVPLWSPCCREPDVLEPDETVGEFTGLVFFLCIIANMMAFMLAWFYIFDTIQKVRGSVPEAASPTLLGFPACRTCPPACRSLSVHACFYLSGTWQAVPQQQLFFATPATHRTL